MKKVEMTTTEFNSMEIKDFFSFEIHNKSVIFGGRDVTEGEEEEEEEEWVD